jgi:hypothetical protein
MFRTIRAALTALALTAVPFAAPALAADPPAPTPPATPVKLVIPAGFEKVEVGGHTALAEPNDVKWVKDALTAIKAPDKVKGGPEDMIDSIKKENRATVTRQMSEDLGITEQAAAQFLDATVVPALEKLITAKPPLFYLVATDKRLLALVKTGWGEPTFHYNRVADAVEYRGNLNFQIDKEMDDVVLPTTYAEAAAADARGKDLTAAIQNVNARLKLSAAQNVGSTVFGKFVEFVDKQLEGFKLKPDQAWFNQGVTNCLAAKYVAVLTGADKKEIVNALVQEAPNFPISTRSIDLLSPTDTSKINPALQPYYVDAVRRKSIAVVWLWINKAGEKAIPDMLKSLRAGVPADGKALVKQIEATTTVDVTPWLSGIAADGKPTNTPATPAGNK